MGRCVRTCLIWIVALLASAASAQTPTPADLDRPTSLSFEDLIRDLPDAQAPPGSDITDLSGLYDNPEAINGCMGNAECERLVAGHVVPPMDLEGTQELLDGISVDGDTVTDLADALDSVIACVAGEEAETRETTESFEYRCESGFTVEESRRTCEIVLRHDINDDYTYECETSVNSETGDIVVSDECEVLQADPTCVLAGSSCSQDGGEVTRDVVCRMGPASFTGEASCSDELIHELELYYSYSCAFVWDEAQATFVPDPVCADLLDDDNCTPTGRECAADGSAPREDRTCSTGETYDIETETCMTGLALQVDEQHGYDVVTRWSAEDEAFLPDAMGAAVLAASCDLGDDHCTEPFAGIEHTLTCEVGVALEENTTQCVLERDIQTDDDYLYRALRRWDARIRTHRASPEWAALVDNRCASQGESCIEPTPPSYDYFTCNVGYRDSYSEQSCLQPREVVVDADYIYRTHRDWVAGRDRFEGRNGHSRLADQVAAGACELLGPETCIVDSPGVFETRTCQRGYELVDLDVSVTESLEIEVEDSFVYIGSRNWNAQARRFDDDAVTLAARGRRCEAGAEACVRESGGVRDERACNEGFSLTEISNACERTLRVTTEADYIYQADRAWIASSASFVDSRALDALQAAPHCVKQGETCTETSPGVFETQTCELGAYSSSVSETVVSDRLFETDLDYYYTGRRSWNGARHAPDAKWTALDADSTCEPSDTKCAQTTAPSYDTYSCEQGYRDTVTEPVCTRRRIVEVDADYKYRGTQSWNGTRFVSDSTWSAAGSASCTVLSDTCDTESPGVTEPFSCDEGYRITAETDSCRITRSMRVDRDYGYTGYETFGSGSFSRDATLRAADRSSSAQSCTRTEREGLDPHTDLFSEFQCMRGSITFGAEETCEVTLNATMTGSVRGSASIIGSNWPVPSYCSVWQSGTGGGYYGSQVTYWKILDCDRVPSWGPGGPTNFYIIHDEREVVTTQDTSACASAIDRSLPLVDTSCVEGTDTRTVGSLEHSESCWRWERTYGSTQEQSHDSCQAPSGYDFDHEVSYDPQMGESSATKIRVYRKPLALADADDVRKSKICFKGWWRNASGNQVPVDSCTGQISGYSLKKTACLYSEDGTCRMEAKTYDIARPGPPGGYARYRESWTCEEALSGSGVATPTISREFAGYTSWDYSACNAAEDALPQSEGCTRSDANRPASTITVDGFSKSGIWSKNRLITCEDRETVNECPANAASLIHRPRSAPRSDWASLAPPPVPAPEPVHGGRVVTAEARSYRAPVVLAAAGDLTFTGRTCIARHNGTCTLWRRDYDREVEDPSGGCHVRARTYRCETPLGSGHAVLDTFRDIVANTIEAASAACAEQHDDSACRVIRRYADTSTGGRRTIDGLVVDQPHWEEKTEYECSTREEVNECSPVREGYSQYDVDCLVTGEDGACTLSRRHYRKLMPDPTGGCTTYEDTFLCENRNHGVEDGTELNMLDERVDPEPAAPLKAAGCVRRSHAWGDREVRTILGHPVDRYWSLTETFDCKTHHPVNTCEAGEVELVGRHHSTLTRSTRVPLHASYALDRTTTMTWEGDHIRSTGSRYLLGMEKVPYRPGATVQMSIDGQLERAAGAATSVRMGLVYYNVSGALIRSHRAAHPVGLGAFSLSSDLVIQDVAGAASVRPYFTTGYIVSGTSAAITRIDSARYRYNDLQDAAPQQVSSTCSRVSASGACEVREYTYRAQRDDPSGGCHRYREEYRCDTEVAGAGTPVAIPREEGDSTWIEPQCTALDEESSCFVTQTTCLEGRETRDIDGVSITRDCWKERKTYDCDRETGHNSCAVSFVSLFGGADGQTVDNERKIFYKSGDGGEYFDAVVGDTVRFNFSMNIVSRPDPAPRRRVYAQLLHYAQDGTYLGYENRSVVIGQIGLVTLDAQITASKPGTARVRPRFLVNWSSSETGGGLFHIRRATMSLKPWDTLAPDWALLSSRCTDRAPDGSCRSEAKVFETEGSDPSGGCHRYEREWTCASELDVSDAPLRVNRWVANEAFADTLLREVEQTELNGGSCDFGAVETACPDGEDTRTINGLEVSRACWERERTVPCQRRDEIDSCVAPHIPDGSEETGSECVRTQAGGSCDLREYAYRVELPDPSGGCHRYQQDYICEDAQDSLTPHDIHRSVVSDDFDRSACSDVDAGFDGCVPLDTVCAEGPETRDIDGLAVTRSCWAEKKRYSCFNRETFDTCDLPSNAELTGRSCIWEDRLGVCRLFASEHRSLLPDPTGGCTTYEGDFLCEDKVGRAGTPYDTRREVVSSDWDLSDCKTPDGFLCTHEDSCVSGKSTRTVAGVQLTLDCWKTNRTYDCQREHRVDTCRGIPLDAELVEERCARHDIRDDRCVLFGRDYRWFVDDGSGFCHERTRRAWCDAAVPGTGAADDYRYRNQRLVEEASACRPLEGQDSCVEVARRCADDRPQTRVPDLFLTSGGTPFTPAGPIATQAQTSSCWAEAVDYECETATPVDTCGDIASDGTCTLTDRQCVERNRAGECGLFETTYDCADGGRDGCIEEEASFECRGPATQTSGKLGPSVYAQADGSGGGRTGLLTPTSVRAAVLSSYWTDTCAQTSAQGSCSLMSDTCAEPGTGAAELPRRAQDDFHQAFIEDAETVVEDCFRRERVYECSVSSDQTACTTEAQDCSDPQPICLLQLDDGQCAIEEVGYTCTVGQCGPSRFVCDPRRGDAFYRGYKYRCSETHSPGDGFATTCGGLESCRRKLIRIDRYIDESVGPRDGRRSREDSVFDRVEHQTFDVYCDAEVVPTGGAIARGFVEGEGMDADSASCSDAPTTCQLSSSVCLDGLVSSDQARSTLCEGGERKVYECEQGDSGSCSSECTSWRDEFVCENQVEGAGTPVGTDATIVAYYDETDCGSSAGNEGCEIEDTVCVEGPGTRLVEDAPVTAECWRWERAFRCETITGEASDCDVPEACVHLRDECLGSADDGTCLTTEHIYSCSETNEYVVSPAVAGTCESDDDDGSGGGTAVNEDGETQTGSGFASGPLGALMSLNAGGEDYDDGNGAVSLFAGDALKCSKLILGTKNCCKRSGPLLFLGCSASESKLQLARQDNLCVALGSYCSKKAFLGACLKKKETFCCYDGEISKIVAEAGRRQLGKSWGTPKHPDCGGFSVPEFQSLDLTHVDFSSVADSMIEQMGVDADGFQDQLTDRINQMKGGGQ